MSYFLFSCEIGQREYLPRLWFAVLAAARLGVNSVIGHKFVIADLLTRNVGFGKGDVFFHKDGNTDAIKYLKCAKNSGLTTVALDEEFLNWIVPDQPLHLLSPQSKNYIDAFFSSTEHTRVLAEDLSLSTFATGNLRIGMASHLAQRESRGDDETYDICINSPTGVAFSLNPLVAHLEIMSRLSNGSVYTALRELAPQVMDEFSIFEMIVKAIQDHQNCEDRILIRRHPAESPFVWAELGRELGVDIDEGRLNSILRSWCSKKVIGFDCTTLLECLYLDRPFLNLGINKDLGNRTIAGRYLRGDFTSSDDRRMARSKLGDVVYSTDVFESWIQSLLSLPGVTLQRGDTLNFSHSKFKVHPDIELRRGRFDASSISLLIRQFDEDLRGVKIRILGDDLVHVFSGN